MAADHRAQYGYRPWLRASFMDTEQFLGTCHHAANCLAVGPIGGVLAARDH